MPSSEKTLNDWLNEGRREDRTTADFMERNEVMTPAEARRFIFYHNLPVICADGYQVSIQASANHYCNPTEGHRDVANYDTFELGFPSMTDECLYPYADITDVQQACVFSRVPREVIEQVLARHGGIVALKDCTDYQPFKPEAP